VSINTAPEKLVPLTRAPKTHASEVNPDASGNEIMNMLQRAAELANQDCQRAMDLAHRLSLQIRAAEARERELEAELDHVRDRASRAEGWLLRIQKEIEGTFFKKKSTDESLDDLERLTAAAKAVTRPQSSPDASLHINNRKA
jgi:hypothetical protein